MERVKDFDAFYDLKIQPILPQLKREGRRARGSKILMVISGFLLIPSFVIYAADIEGGPGGWLPAIVAGVFVGCIFYSGYWGDKYEDDFKKKIIGEIIAYLHEGLLYKPDKYIPAKEYRASGLFTRKYDHYSGSDYIRGIYKDISFHCSELSTAVDPKENDSRGAEIFNGIFFAAAISSYFSGATYVWKKGESQLPKSLADQHYRMYPLPHVQAIHTPDEEFHKLYSVYSTDAGEAGTILSRDMTHCMTAFRNQIQRDVVFSFVAGRCYVAINIDEDLLEPAGIAANREEVKEYFFAILLILSIINQLPLKNLQ